MSAARYPQIDDHSERVDETVQITLRCYSYGSASDWVPNLPMVDFFITTFQPMNLRHI